MTISCLYSYTCICLPPQSFGPSPFCLGRSCVQATCAVYLLSIQAFGYILLSFHFLLLSFLIVEPHISETNEPRDSKSPHSQDNQSCLSLHLICRSRCPEGKCRCPVPAGILLMISFMNLVVCRIWLWLHFERLL